MSTCQTAIWKWASWRLPWSRFSFACRAYYLDFTGWTILRVRRRCVNNSRLLLNNFCCQSSCCSCNWILTFSLEYFFLFVSWFKGILNISFKREIIDFSNHLWFFRIVAALENISIVIIKVILNSFMYLRGIGSSNYQFITTIIIVRRRTFLKLTFILLCIWGSILVIILFMFIFILDYFFVKMIARSTNFRIIFCDNNSHTIAIIIRFRKSYLHSVTIHAIIIFVNFR